MNYAKVALMLALSGALVAGCGDDGGGTDGGSGDMCTTGDTVLFVVDTLNVGAPDPMGDPKVSPGFNLDGVVNDEANPDMLCFAEDFTSPAPDNEPGVDNQLGGILNSISGSLDVEGSIEEAILDGDLLLLLELENVDDPMNDGCVTLNIYLGQMPGGGMPVDSDGDGRIDSGQTIDINPISVMGGEPVVTVQGSITNGRMSAGPVDISLSLPVAGAGLDLNLSSAQVRMSLAADGTVTDGVIGGALGVQETIGTIVAVAPDAVTESFACNILKPQADLQTGLGPAPGIGDACTSMMVGEDIVDSCKDVSARTSCNEETSTCQVTCDLGDSPCDAVSLGLVFTGVDAVKGAVGS